MESKSVILVSFFFVGMQVPSMLSTSLNAEALQFLQGYLQAASVQLVWNWCDGVHLIRRPRYTAGVSRVTSGRMTDLLQLNFSLYRFGLTWHFMMDLAREMIILPEFRRKSLMELFLGFFKDMTKSWLNWKTALCLSSWFAVWQRLTRILLSGSDTIDSLIQ